MRLPSIKIGDFEGSGCSALFSRFLRRCSMKLRENETEMPHHYVAEIIFLELASLSLAYDFEPPGVPLCAP